MIVGIVNWIGKNVPLLSLILIGGGAFLLMLAVWPNIWRLWRKVKSQPSPDWLEQELSSDLQRIPKGMRGRVTRWDFSGIYNRESYFDVFVELTNTTLFTFCLKGVKGFMKIAGEPCINPPQVSTRFGIKRDEPADIRLRQPIAPETVVIIQDAGNSNQEIEFNLGEVIFEIENTTEGYEKYKPYMTGGDYTIVPSIDDVLKIEVSKCSIAEEQLRPLETLTLVMAMAVRAISTPVELASLQLCIGEYRIDPVSPMLPVTVLSSPTSYRAKYEVSILTLIEKSDKREAGRILTLAIGQSWLSNEFQIPYDSSWLPQEVNPTVNSE